MTGTPGFYERRIFPWLNDRYNTTPELDRMRREALSAATGRVIEIGLGTGLNLPHYPPAVRPLVGVEPSDGMLARSAARVRAAPFPVEIVVAPAERLPFEDGEFDTAASVLTLCTVRDPGQVVAELRRVLRDGGRLLVLEHGLADDAGVAAWQHRLDWLQTKVACGCHLVRPIAEILEAGGFRFERVRRFFVPTLPRTHGWVTAGVAVKP